MNDDEDLLLQCSNYTQRHASIHLLTPTSPLDELQSALPQDASKLAFHPSFRMMICNHDVPQGMPPDPAMIGVGR